MSEPSRWKITVGYPFTVWIWLPVIEFEMLPPVTPLYAGSVNRMPTSSPRHVTRSAASIVVLLLMSQKVRMRSPVVSKLTTMSCWRVIAWRCAYCSVVRTIVAIASARHFVVSMRGIASVIINPLMTTTTISSASVKPGRSVVRRDDSLKRR